MKSLTFSGRENYIIKLGKVIERKVKTVAADMVIIVKITDHS